MIPRALIFGLVAIAMWGNVAWAGTTEPIETKVWIGVVAADSCAVGSPNAQSYPVRYSSASDAEFVKFQSVVYSGGDPWMPEILIRFGAITTDSGNPPGSVEEVLDLGELTLTEIGKDRGYRLGPGVEMKAKVRPSTMRRKLWVPFEVVIVPRCCPTSGAKYNVTGTVIIGPDERPGR